MGLFFHREKARSGTHPYSDWPWTLTVDGIPRTDFTWADIRREVGNLNLAQDSFLILEKKNPADPKQYWYIQSAVNRAGEQFGQFTVGVGYAAPQGPALFERCERTAEDVLPWFEAAFQGRPVDLSRFEDRSDWLRA